MLRMSERAIGEFVKSRLSTMQYPCFDGLEFICNRSERGWHLTLVVDDKMPIRMCSQRDDSRRFASLDAANKVAASILNGMTVIGK